MLRKIIFIILLIASNSSAKLWYITRGLANQDERAWAVAVDSAGSVYWAIEEKDQWPFWYFNILLFKIEPNAHQVWQSASWGWNFNEIAFIAKEKGGRLYLAGRIDSTAALDGSGGNALVLSFDANTGEYEWHYVWDQGFGYEEIDGLAIQPDGIYVAGWSMGQHTDMDILVQKISLNGQPIWSNTWDYDNLGKFDGANGHMAMDDKCIYVAAHVNRTNIASLNGDGALVCFDRTDGAYQWHVTWGGAGYDDALGLAMSTDSMLYVLGNTSSFGKGSQVYLNKYSRAGQLIWSNLWGGNGAEDARALVTDGDSVIYVVGSTSSYGYKGGDYDLFVLKYNSTGTLMDSLLWGGAYRETAHDVAMHGDYLYISGETNSFGQGDITGEHKADALLLKVNGRIMQSPDSTMARVVTSLSSVTGYELKQNYPNPFNPVTIIEYTVKEPCQVTLKVFDIRGREVTVLIDTKHQPGSYKVNFDASHLATGVYFYRIQMKDFVAVRKMVLLE